MSRKLSKLITEKLYEISLLLTSYFQTIMQIVDH